MGNGLDNYLKRSEAGKIPVKIIHDSGGLVHFMQEMKIMYLEGSGKVSPKVTLSISTTNPNERTPRSFRTADSNTLRTIINQLTKCLQRLEKDSD